MFPTIRLTYGWLLTDLTLLHYYVKELIENNLVLVMDGRPCSVNRLRLKTRRLPVTVFGPNVIRIVQARVDGVLCPLVGFSCQLTTGSPPIDISAIVVIFLI
jgi:hypothetical protein